jgi:hypothetical protein
MEHVTVTYPEERTVFIDGEEGGLTNETLTVEEGTHTFSLGKPFDYVPRAITLPVVGTTSVKPLEVTFAKIA